MEVGCYIRSFLCSGSTNGKYHVTLCSLRRKSLPTVYAVSVRSIHTAIFEWTDQLHRIKWPTSRKHSLNISAYADRSRQIANNVRNVTVDLKDLSANTSITKVNVKCKVPVL
jgi:hypothetical protein